MHNNTGPPDTNAFNDLFPAILECFGIILLGYIAGRSKVISPTNAKGLGNYVAYFALPALVFKAMVEMDFSTVNWLFWCSILISKTVIFVLVYCATLIIARKMDVGRAGIFAIFASQSNDFALGYPIITSLYRLQHPEYVSYLYLVGPISLAILNPIGFFSMEIQRNRQATHRPSRLGMLGRAAKGFLTNPIIIVVIFGIVGNLMFDHELPQIMSEILSVLANSFSATALFFLGTGLVGKVKKTPGLFFLTPMLLIGCKLILMPLVIHQVVLILNPGGNNASLTDSFASFGFLYGTIPTAPSVYMFATLYQQSENAIASSMVLCTFASAPMMFITATIVNLPVQASYETQQLMSTVMVDVGCVGIACCAWILIVFILSKRFKLIPHHFTMHLAVAQLLASIGIVLASVENDSAWFLVIRSVILLMGVFSSRCWAALLAIALCVMRCRSVCFVLRYRFAFCIYGWAVPTLLVALIIAVAAPSGQGVFLGGQFQLIASLVILGANFLMAIIALVVLHRKDRYQHQDSNDGSNSAGETERMLKTSKKETICKDPLDIEDVRTTYHTCSLNSNCTDGQRETCRRRMQQYNHETRVIDGTYLDTDDIVASQQLGRHILLLLFLLLSMMIGFSMCLWKVSGEPQNSLFIMLEFLDIVLAYCQGFFTLAIFGFDTQNVIIPFYNTLRRWLCNKTYRRSSTDVEELDDETQHIVQQFSQHHFHTCRKDILKNVRCGMQEIQAFYGLDFVDWLIEVGLSMDRDTAVEYGNKLVIGGVITHVDNVHGFQDSRLLYSFTDSYGSASNDLNCNNDLNVST